MKGGTELTNPQLSTLLLVFRHEARLHPALSRPPASARRARPRLSTSVPKRKGASPLPHAGCLKTRFLERGAGSELRTRLGLWE